MQRAEEPDDWTAQLQRMVKTAAVNTTGSSVWGGNTSTFTLTAPIAGSQSYSAVNLVNNGGRG